MPNIALAVTEWDRRSRQVLAFSTFEVLAEATLTLDLLELVLLLY